jgi:uncharacterized membrane protein
MSLDPSQARPSAQSRASQTATGIILWIARHWLALFNTAWAIYFLTPFLPPIFLHFGWTAPAQVIYTVYSFLCHQLPSHSYFLFGPELAPHREELIAGGMSASTNLYAQRAFYGNSEAGWKVALCQRDVAIYASVFVTGLIYGLVRRRVRPMPFKIYALFLIPIALDGLTQLVGWRESNWWLRTLTGALFGGASVFFAYPYVDDAMNDVIDDEMARTAR